MTTFISDTPTVEKLRKSGWKVLIEHQRNINQDAKKNSDMYLFPLYQIRQYPLDMSSIITKGGETVVEITPAGFESNVVFIGRAVCSCKDTYNKKEGVKLALTRALAQFESAINPPNNV